MTVELEPIGVVHVDCETLPRHWSASDVEGEIEVLPRLAPGLSDLAPGERIVVLFHFHRSPAFTDAALHQVPPHGDRAKGVFAICSPLRPNPLGLSVLELLAVEGNRLRVRGLDMLDGTPVLDIKPHIEAAS